MEKNKTIIWIIICSWLIVKFNWPIKIIGDGEKSDSEISRSNKSLFELSGQLVNSTQNFLIGRSSGETPTTPSNCRCCQLQRYIERDALSCVKCATTVSCAIAVWYHPFVSLNPSFWRVRAVYQRFLLDWRLHLIRDTWRTGYVRQLSKVMFWDVLSRRDNPLTRPASLCSNFLRPGSKSLFFFFPLWLRASRVLAALRFPPPRRCQEALAQPSARSWVIAIQDRWEWPTRWWRHHGASIMRTSSASLTPRSTATTTTPTGS